MSPSQTESQSDREIVLTRIVDAPRALVWRIWTEAEHVPRWWGPTGFTTTTEEMQVRPGGCWRFTMHGPDGRDYPNRITYLEVEEPVRLVYRHGGEAGLEPVNFQVIVTFEELAPRQTRVTLHSIFPSAQARDFVVREYGAIEGGKQTLARMAAQAAALAAGSEAEPGEFVLHRVLAAPRDLVYEAWTRAEHLASWFGPKGCELEVKRLELRPGGVFHYAMGFPDRPPMYGLWSFREVVPGERLVYVASFADEAGTVARAPFEDPWPMHMHSTVTFEDHAGIGRGTVLTLRVHALEAAPVERETFQKGHPSMRQGWGGTLEQLEAYLAERQD